MFIRCLPYPSYWKDGGTVNTVTRLVRVGVDQTKNKNGTDASFSY